MSEQQHHNNNVHNAFKNNSISTLINLTKIQPLTDVQCNMFVDVALEDGNEKMAKFLVNDEKCVPSLYAKQMAHVNGHHKLSFWMDAYSPNTRNGPDIKTVHYNYKQKTWNNHIPEEYRY
jgi:hypothetical protein